MRPELAPFWGRAEERAQLGQLFGGGARVVSIVGPSGMGKTRLAQAWAEGSARPLRLDLTRTRVGSPVLSALGRALELRPGASRGRTLQRVQEALAGHSLLLLDSAERALEEVAELVPGLATAVPILITSRESLRLPGEAVLELGPLAPAVALEMLLDRATEARAGVRPNDDERALLGQIAQDLEGIPLALELAGSRLGVMSAASFSARLHQRFDLLVSNRRGIDPRHRTLRAALDASYETLSADEQRVLAWVSLWAGSFELGAVEALLQGSLPAEGVVAAVEALHQKSWLIRRLSGSAVRFELYETLRSYAAERLQERQEQGPAWARLADHVLALAEGTPPVWERENLLAIYAQASLPASQRARAILALEETLAASESSKVHLALLERLDGDAEALPPTWAARLRLAIARAKDRSGDGPGAQGALVTARRLARRAQDRDLRIELATTTINLAYMHSQNLRAVAWGRRLERWARPAGRPWVQVRLQTELGVAFHMAGDRDAALRRYQAALALAEATEDQDGVGRVLACLGFLRQDWGALPEAELAYRRALEIQETLGHQDVRGIVLGYLGNLERRRGRLLVAQGLYARALKDLRAIDDRSWVAVVNMDLGLLLLDHGRYGEAASALDEALASLETLGHPDLAALVESGLAVARAGQGGWAIAHQHLDRAQARLPADEPRAMVVALHGAWLKLAEQGAAPVVEAQALLQRAQPDVERDDYVRLAAQLLLRALAQHQAPADVDLCAADGTYFQLAGQPRVVLEKREPLRRILACLVQARLETPGESRSTSELAKAGWPEEKILEAAAKNRVRVAIATLRGLGLRSQLQTKGEGYLLDPEPRCLVT